MADLASKKRMAATILDVGLSRVKFDPERLDDIENAITRASIRSLVKDGAIRVEDVKGISRGRFRSRGAKKRTRGPGSKEGSRGARLPSKTRWVSRVRVLRRHLKVLKDRGAITNQAFNVLHRQVKGGQVRSLRHLRELVKVHLRR